MDTLIHFRTLDQQPYSPIWEQMKRFTTERTTITKDEIWLLEHDPVYTQGQAGKPEHLLRPSHIPLIQSDRGGQITYHAPGQLIGYVLLDLRRRNLSIRRLVSLLENCLMTLLEHYHIPGETRCGAPGIYVFQKKIASIGLRVKNGCTYHGIALNVAMNLNPFKNINPCGFAQLEMTQMHDFLDEVCIKEVQQRLKGSFLTVFG